MNDYDDSINAEDYNLNIARVINYVDSRNKTSGLYGELINYQYTNEPQCISNMNT